MTRFTLKAIALIAMIINHMGIMLTLALPDHAHIFIWLRAVGRLVWPIFAVLLAESFWYTKSPEKFLMRLLVFALLSEIPFDIVMGNPINFLSNTNIFYTLFLGGMAICWFERLKQRQELKQEQKFK